MAELKDSGTRRKFESGAVRDIQEGKGRCDLLPLFMVARYLEYTEGRSNDRVVELIHHFTSSGSYRWLIAALEAFRSEHSDWDAPETLILEVSKQFEDGAVKYGERNWEKGIPVHCYIDSALRHYLKWKRGDTDEPHDRAFCWNLLCACWTCYEKPDLNEFEQSSVEL